MCNKGMSPFVTPLLGSRVHWGPQPGPAGGLIASAPGWERPRGGNSPGRDWKSSRGPSGAKMLHDTQILDMSATSTSVLQPFETLAKVSG